MIKKAAMEYNPKIIGRRHEQDLIAEYCETPKAELVAVYGRRRVGKTYLIKQYFDNKFDFCFTGSFETTRSTQLTLFKKELERYSQRKQLRNKHSQVVQKEIILDDLFSDVQ